MSTLLSSLTTYLPQHPGLLPHWLLFVGAIATLNTIQAYTTLNFTQQVYLGLATPLPSTPASSSSPATPLASRLFGTWTFLQGIVRIYAAYNIDNPAFYQLAFATYAIAFSHFVSEWFVFGTARWGRGLAGPVVVSTVSLAWMVSQWGFYVR